MPLLPWNAEYALARNLRLAVIQDQHRQGRLTENEAKELLRGPISPRRPDLVFDDSGRLEVVQQHEVPR